MPTFALNFSRPGAQVVAQYYIFLRLGWDGYRRVQQTSQRRGHAHRRRVAAMGPFRAAHRRQRAPGVRVHGQARGQELHGFDVSAALRERGWLVPAYTFPANRQDLAVLRVVVRNGFTHDLADLFLDDLRKQIARLGKLDAPLVREAEASSFHH